VTDALTSELRALLTLHLVPGLGPRLTAALLERFGSAEGVLAATAQELQEVPHVGEKVARQVIEALGRGDVDAELELMAQHGVHLRVLGSADYPATLATITVPPQLLYVRGTLEERDAGAVAVVGARECTPYGRRVAERLGADLARAGVTVISGLARGIDGCAHRGALQEGGRTLAVLAGGLSRIYPPEHAELADQVVASGALISESAMRMEPMAGMFPARNRIISGLARAVVVVEANEKSGALITARHAAEQGREIFAIPGQVDSAASAGTLQLLRDGAKLVRHARDILEDLGDVAPIVTPGSPPAVPSPAPPKEPPAGLDDTQRRIWEALGEQPLHADMLAQRLQLPVPELSRALMLLEMRRVVRRLPGNRFERS
jgi:DNA processing protein